eukprot:CAMPEP_0114426814 /NCGR_PEP_ID=MMETSP0103-20121206/8003_1 /TAXON_ID=37642 ORGANISM="Paraphysomonas imperforata, Strain PA2" /NCGR_SAMPLE_ID=MMETSP0103 /ASSEMBLY_ACC=CAM_ASM_000201 /LENGTH=351 /DNA_ID=CAMNT_0001595809 /DNA_START=418 /DNA_END=1473 /DNA_ORIENTATION=-
MKIKPDRQILDHLDNLGLGYAAKRRSRKAIATKYEKELPGVQSVVRSAENAVRSRRKTKGETGKKIINASPYPFNKGPRKIQNIVTARQWGEVPDFGPVPEVAVIGRSNVGKSTLLNAILGYTSSHVQKAAVSNKPGETTALQFFTLGKHITTKQPTLVVTDMPGYGFAFMKPEEAKRCFHLCSEYLLSRGKRLKRVLLLIDARHGFKQADFICLDNLLTNTYTGPNPDTDSVVEEEEAVQVQPVRKSRASAGNSRAISWKLQVVLTKCDLVERSELARRVQLVREQLAHSFPALRVSNMPVLMLSALEGRGVVELHRDLASLVPPSASGHVASAHSSATASSDTASSVPK